jgi:hypothetical protein
VQTVRHSPRLLNMLLVRHDKTAAVACRYVTCHLKRVCVIVISYLYWLPC